MHKFSWCVHGGCVDTIRILLAMLQLMLEVASEKGEMNFVSFYNVPMNRLR